MPAGQRVQQLGRHHAEEGDCARLRAWPIAAKAIGGRAHDPGRDRQGFEGRPGQIAIAEQGLVAAPGRLGHDAVSGRFQRQAKPGQNIGHKVEPEQFQRRFHLIARQDCFHNQHKDFAEIGRGHEMHRLADIRQDGPALFDAIAYRGKVARADNHICHIAGNARAVLAHGDGYVRSAQGGSIVEAVPRHPHDKAGALKGFDDVQLLGGGNAREHIRLLSHNRKDLGIQVFEVARVEDAHGPIAAHAKFCGDGGGGRCLIAGNHYRAYAGLPQSGDQLMGALHERIFKARGADPDQVCGIGVQGGPFLVGKAENP